MNTDYKQHKFAIGTEEIIEKWASQGLMITISLVKLEHDNVHEYKGTAFSNKLRKTTYVYTRVSKMDMINELEL